MTEVPTRGERNNNPGNLRYEGIEWLALAMPPKDADGYCVFREPLYGLRALCRDLFVKWRDDGLRTISAILAKYAPAGDRNNVGAYEADVAARMGIAADTALTLSDPAQLQVFAHSIVLHENGRCIYSDDLIARAVRMAIV